MKRCPECRRDYYDNSLLYCLDDGSALLDGPAMPEPPVSLSGKFAGEPATAILRSSVAPDEAGTRAQIDITNETAILPASTGSVSGTASKKSSLIAGVLGILLVTSLGAGSYLYYGRGSSKQIDSIAVMPFINDSGNADVEYLSDGMTDTLISSLSQLANLNVKGRSSVFRYKGRDMDARTLGKELGVQAVLFGRVIQRNDQITLSLELLDALTENVIWSGKYDRKQADVVTLQSEIARDVSNKLKSRLSGTDAAKVEKGYTADPEAYKLYLQGRFHWNKRTEADLKKSIQYFDQAIARDPGYALAYSGLGAVYMVMSGYTLDPPPDVAFPKARAAALKALEIDPTLAEPHATLATALHEFDWDHSEAEKEYKRAIELDPNNATAHQWHGNFLMDMGRFDEAIAEMKRAIELDPLSPIINSNLGNVYRAARRYDEAIAQYKKALEIVPNFEIAKIHLDRTYVLKGMYEEVIEGARQSMLSAGMTPAEAEKKVAPIRDAYRNSGAKGFWQNVLERQLAAAQAGHPDADDYEMACFQLGAGNRDGALNALEKMVANGRGMTGTLWLRSDPVWDPLRTEPRFRELLRKTGMPE